MDDHKDIIVVSMDNFYIKSEEIEDEIDGKMEYGNTFHYMNKTDATDCPDVTETEHIFPKYETNEFFLEGEMYDGINDMENGTTPLVKVEEELLTQDANDQAGYDVILCITPEEPQDKIYPNVKLEDDNCADHMSEVCDEQISTVGGCNPRTPKQIHIGRDHYSSAVNIKSEASTPPGSSNDYDENILEDGNENKFTKDGVPNTCPVCYKCFKQPSDLEKHMFMNSEKTSNSCAISGNLKQPMSNHSRKTPFVCNVCQKSFTTAGRLKTHMVIHSGKRPHICTMCHKGFTRADCLKSHLLLHSSECPHKCTVCGKSFKRTCDLTNHMVVHSVKRPHVCTICSKAFKRAAILTKHMLVHSGEWPHRCTVCNKGFSQTGGLKTHMFIHSGERPHTCTECNKSFTQAGTLIKHMLVHSGERPHKCTMCNKSFAQVSTLTGHMFVHSGEWPHKCTVCNKGFSQASSLKIHMFIHSGERPHTCTVCDKSFTRTGTLIRHMLVHSG